MMTALVPKPKRFPYSRLEYAVRRVVVSRTNEIHMLTKRTAENAVAIGFALIAVKEALEHGQFLPWLEAEFSWSEATAQRLMNAARHFGKSRRLKNFGSEALYMLSAPSVPDEAREEAETLASHGETITSSKAREIIASKKPAEVLKGLTAEQQLEVLAKAREYQGRREEERNDQPAPEETQAGHREQAAKHIRLAHMHLEALSGKNERWAVRQLEAISRRLRFT